MKAIHLQQFGVENLQVTDIPRPASAANEVLIKVEAASLNAADIGTINGLYNPNLSFPHIPVSDGAGIVEEVGANVTRWKKGDRVTVHFIKKWLAGTKTSDVFRYKSGIETPGVLAEYITSHEDALVRTPDNLASEAASTLPIAGLTAWTGLVEYAGLRSGQTVLTQGTGGVSIFALQIANIIGAKVIATSSSDAKLEKLKALGAEEVINYKTNPDWHEEARRLTNGKGVDVILDVVGGESVNKSLKAIGPDGFIGLVGLLDTPVAQVDIFSAIATNASLRGISVGSREQFEHFIQAIETTKLQPVIDKVFAFDKALDAFAYFNSGAHVGKVVIKL